MNLLNAIAWIESLMGYGRGTPYQGGTIPNPSAEDGVTPPCIPSRPCITATPARVHVPLTSQNETVKACREWLRNGAREELVLGGES